MQISGVATEVKPFRVLICDDQADVLEALRLLLKGQGWQAVTADSPQGLLRAVRTEAFDLILVDLNYTRDTTSGEEGMDLLATLEAEGNHAPVMVMTAWSSFDLAVEAMRRGACDFIQKPWDNERLLAAIRKQAESERRRKSELEIAANVQQKLFPRNQRLLGTWITRANAWPRARWAATITISWIPATTRWDSCSRTYRARAFQRRS